MNLVLFKKLRFSWFHCLIFFLCTIPSTNAKNDAEKYQLYLWANYNQLENRSAVAQHCYELLFRNHRCPYVYPGFLLHLMQTKQFDAIVRLIPVVEATQKQDFSTQLIFINALESLGKHNDVIQRLISLSKQYPEHPEIIFYTANIHAQNNHLNEAIQVIDSYLNHAPHSPKNFIFYFLKAQILSRAGNQEQAIINVKKSLDLHPQFDQGWLFLGMIHELAGNIDEALNHYQTCLNIVGTNPILEKQIFHLQLKRQQLTHHTGITQPFTEALNAYDQKQYQKSLHIINQTEILHNHMPSRLLKVELLCKLNNVDEAIALLIQWMHQEESNETWYRALHLLHKAGVTAAATLDAFSRVEQKNKNNILALLYKADIYLKMKDKDQAVTYLNKSLACAQHPLLQTKILFQMGLIYYHDQQWEKMCDVLIKGKDLQQNYPPLLNLLAYHYATKGNNLKEAEQLILKVLQHEKNPHFLDTHALILYKQKKFDEAHAILSSIAQEIPKDSTALFHLAKTMRKKGLHQEARNTLENAVNYCSMETDKTKYQKCLQNWAQRK
jgi:tetratricopeptide (TPR) repeat protein